MPGARHGEARLGCLPSLCLAGLLNWPAVLVERLMTRRLKNLHSCLPTRGLQGEAVVQQQLEVDGRTWLMTCVSMGNPHAITYGLSDGTPIKARVAALLRAAPRRQRPAQRPAAPSRVSVCCIDACGWPNGRPSSVPACAWMACACWSLGANCRLRAAPAQVDELDLPRIGPMFEHNPVFPARTNTGGRCPAGGWDWQGQAGGLPVQHQRRRSAAWGCEHAGGAAWRACCAVGAASVPCAQAWHLGQLHSPAGAVAAAGWPHGHPSATGGGPPRCLQSLSRCCRPATCACMCGSAARGAPWPAAPAPAPPWWRACWRARRSGHARCGAGVGRSPRGAESAPLATQTKPSLSRRLAA